MKKYLAAAVLLLATPALAQNVQQSGSVTRNHIPVWVTSGVIGDGGSSTDSPISSIGVTNNGGSGICVNSARQTSGAYNALCLGASTTGPATISLQNYGTAAAQSLQFVLNGTTLTLPSGGGTFVTATGAFIAEHAACWNSTTGILQDCGVALGAGTQWGVPFYSATSQLASTAAGTNGQVFLGQTGTAPAWATLSGDVSSISAGGALTLGKVNGIPFGTSYTAHGVLLAEGPSSFVSAVTSNIGYCLLSQGTSSDPVWGACASGAGSAGGSNTQVQFNNSTSLGGSANLTWVSPALVIGVAGTMTGQLQLAPAGSASGTVTIQNPSASAAYNFNLPTGAGTSGQALLSGGGGGTPMSFGTLGIAAGGTNSTTASGTTLDNISGFSSTGFINRTGAGTYSFSTTIPVSNGGTALASGTSGGILGYTGSGTLASSALLTQFGVMVGGGAGATPTAITPGSSGQILIQQTGANPSWNSMSSDATLASTGALTIANSAVTVAKMANAAAYTLFGNFTGSSAAPQYSTIGALTSKASPAAGDYVILQDNAAAGQLKYATVSSIASAGSVSSIAGNTGAFTLAGGVTNATNQIQLAGAYASLNAGFNCSIAASVGSNLLTVALKDAGGNDPTSTSPCYINYRDPTASTGATTLVTQTAALSVATTNTAAAGAMGSSNATAFRIWVVAFNNSGTNVLGLINCSNSSTIFPLNEGAVASSTPFSASATSAGVFYTPSGITIASKAFRILGYIEYNSTGLTTAGTYATGPNFIQAFGPGIKRPGEIVQVAQLTSSSATGTSSATAVATALHNTITPSSAANLVKVYFSATNSSAAFANDAVEFGLYRGNNACTTQVGFKGFNGGSTATPVYAMNSGTYYDAPNTTSSQGYTMCAFAQNGANAVGFNSQDLGTTGVFVIEEIQG